MTLWRPLLPKKTAIFAAERIMHTNGNGEVAFRRIFGGVPHFGRVEIKVVKQVLLLLQAKGGPFGGGPHRGCK